MNANELHVHQSFRGVVLWGWLKRFSWQFHFIHGLDTTRHYYDENWLRRWAFHPTATQARGSFLA